ncbi:uncharacterized protein RCO7_02556 [Rhynchosporium graminicola]|uniref:Uncharacterized protein n=1 Tax=Rhynchosporium graminicola TaxID=2792576 RepID=A0A1E1JUC4_9HELO|nr:uncharacterized protein RCO7_02556 [Rhynchosporium commune]
MALIQQSYSQQLIHDNTLRDLKAPGITTQSNGVILDDTAPFLLP